MLSGRALRALATGALGPDCARVAAVTLHTPRSLSAEVWAFAARAEGPDLAHHNVFFRADPAPEFAALMRGKTMPDPTLYVCAMDRGMGAVPPDPERFEIIANAPARPDHALPEETDQCHPRCFETLARFGLTFSPEPTRAALTTPAGFADLFPASKGALYGQSPHGALAALRRPKARTGIRGLYLAGGGTHPGAGVPMAALSGRHVAEAIMRDRPDLANWWIAQEAKPGKSSAKGHCPDMRVFRIDPRTLCASVRSGAAARRARFRRPRCA